MVFWPLFIAVVYIFSDFILTGKVQADQSEDISAHAKTLEKHNDRLYELERNQAITSKDIDYIKKSADRQERLLETLNKRLTMPATAHSGFPSTLIERTE